MRRLVCFIGLLFVSKASSLDFFVEEIGDFYDTRLGQDEEQGSIKTFGQSPPKLINRYERNRVETGDGIHIHSYKVEARITARFAHTTICSRVVNTAQHAQSIVFNVQIPKSAFISNFTMDVNGITFIGSVKEKTIARSLYAKARARGKAAGIISGQVRNMATLKDITMRLKSIKNIQKITKSMKMVAAAKYARAERELKQARVYGTGALALYEKAEIKTTEDKNKHIIIGVSSDRGLCGAIHSNVAKAIKSEIANLTSAGKEIMVISVGDKLRGLLYRTHRNHLLLNFKEVGRKPPTFGDASVIATSLINSGYEFDQGSVIYNKFRSVISYKTDEKPVFSVDTIANSENMGIYDDIDADVLRNYQEFALVNIIYYSLKESTTSEQSARMTAMDNASKNASEIIDKLTLTFNRTRQAVITKELIEIISGAAAL
ncbi:UNVERIFIED_CONTAM: hypothetical protein FKN15_035171 [Acipenser sinensis]